jgi:hypothetical protein
MAITENRLRDAAETSPCWEYNWVFNEAKGRAT